jgi:DNA-binding response OmpR family regulator
MVLLTPNSAPQGRRRLLIVEDDISAIFALRYFFALAGYEVDCAAGPAEGIRLLDHYAYDAVITDLHLLPGRHSEGLRIAHHARQRNPHACIAMLTAHGAEVSADDAIGHGADLFYTKPVELAKLTAGIELTLARGHEPRMATAAPAPDSRTGQA